MITTRKFRSRRCAAALFGVLAFTAVLGTIPAHAEFLGTFGDWEAHWNAEGAAKVCYAATTPTKSAGNYTKRGKIFLLVSHRPADKTLGFVSLEAGYTYKQDGNITAQIGGTSYPMFASGDMAFAFEDKPLVQGMIRGADLTIVGYSARGTKTTDTFSLKGFTAAYNAASKACGVKG